MTYDRPVTDGTGSDAQGGGALFEQVAREPRLSDKVADMMLETILSRRLRVGDRLPSERELGEQFGVSRTVVREAVRALVAKGVLEVRALLEVHIAGVAAERATEGDVQRLREVHERMTREADDLEAAARDDLEFHRMIARATQNDLYLLLMDSIGSALIDIRRENLGSGSTPMTLSQHEAVLGRIAAHDPAGAREAMAAHLEGVAAWWREHAHATPLGGAASA